MPNSGHRQLHRPGHCHALALAVQGTSNTPTVDMTSVQQTIVYGASTLFLTLDHPGVDGMVARYRFGYSSIHLVIFLLKNRLVYHDQINLTSRRLYTIIYIENE
jgi:hypothetical protein